MELEIHYRDSTINVCTHEESSRTSRYRTFSGSFAVGRLVTMPKIGWTFLAEKFDSPENAADYALTRAKREVDLRLSPRKADVGLLSGSD
jgi:hypothetical protein